MPYNANVCDFLVEDGNMYILGYNQRKDQAFDVFIFMMDLKSGEVSERSCLNYPVPPLSFVKVESSFYISMGNKNGQHEKNGMLLMIEA